MTEKASMTEKELARLFGTEVVLHSVRFRKVASRYPRMVTQAYDGDIAAAARDTDEEVARRVREWEIAQGLEPRDWPAIGREQEGRIFDR